MRRSYKTKNRYQTVLCEYLNRREEMKRKYGRTSLYAERAKKINLKISICKKALRRIEEKERQLSEINAMIREFLGVSVWMRSYVSKGIDRDARNIFYRHAIEQGISSYYITKFCGIKKPNRASVQRKVFIRSFATNVHNRELWYRWKEYLQREDLRIAA